MSEESSFPGIEPGMLVPPEPPVPWWGRLLEWLKAVVRFAIAMFVAFTAVCFSALAIKFIWRLSAWVDARFLSKPF